MEENSNATSSILLFYFFYGILMNDSTSVEAKEVCIPLHVNLRKDLYKIIKIDTIYTDTNLTYKKIIYREKRL